MLNATHQPQIAFGRVRHHRTRPAVHAFEYSVYYLRLPLRSMVQAGFATALFSRNRFNLLSFFDKDHGDGAQPLLTWIDALLQAEGIDDADGEIWLQAFPRVLGYTFNPVSFWFCHRKDGALRAILCEVRNTFGEKHHYLLDTGSVMPFGMPLTARKVFHVSPFCPVEGRYQFRFMHRTDAFDGVPHERCVARIDYDDAVGPLLLTSVSGTNHQLSNATVARAFFTYPLMTFGVIARIHWQALRLWIKRVPFFSKPAPPPTGLSR